MKPLAHFSRRELKEALIVKSERVQYSYNDCIAETRHRESKLMTRLMVIAVTGNAMIVAADILTRFFGGTVP